MDSLRTKEKKKMMTHVGFRRPCCFFCVMEETDPCVRRAGFESFLRDMCTRDDGDDETVLTLSFVWNFAMSQTENSELPSTGIFECMVRLIQKSVNDVKWLMRGQNMYIPYYAAHIIGSYTMEKSEFAIKAVESGVIPPLMELMRGKISWVEQRVAVRALGHLASYERTFDAVAVQEDEVVKLAMKIASTCLDVVFDEFVGVKDKEKRVKYHCDLLTRGVGIGLLEMENRKAEEWASQLQYWSLYLLNCFACKERSLSLICSKSFLKDLSKMWGGLVNHNSPAGVGLIRILCYSKQGRGYVSESKEVIASLCNLSRSSDDWQYMGIDCLLLLLKDQDTRYKVIDTALFYLVDLIELNSLNDRPNLGDTIARVLLLHYNAKKASNYSHKSRTALQEIWDMKVETPRKEKKLMKEEKILETRVLLSLIKQQANQLLGLGDVLGAIKSYDEAIMICPLRLRRERMVLYGKRGECYLLLGDPDAAISDSTRALCLSEPVNSHGRSLWTRSRAYDMKGLARESLMDCIMFVNGCCRKSSHSSDINGTRIPYYAAQMISKQMNATWLFADSRSGVSLTKDKENSQDNDSDSDDNDNNSDQEWYNEIVTRMISDKKRFLTGLSTIREEPGRMNDEITSRTMNRKKDVIFARSR